MDSVDFEALLSTRCHRAYLACGAERVVDTLMNRLTGHDVVARIVRGQRCATKRDLFGEWAAALQFPYYFGNNWDALEECLGDLRWLRGSRYLIALTHADQVLPDAVREFDMLMRILKERISLSPPLCLILHCRQETKAQLNRRLAEVGIETVPLSLD